MSSRISWDSILGTAELRRPREITAFADQGTGRTTRIADLQSGPVPADFRRWMEIGRRVTQSLGARMEAAIRSLVPPGVDAVEWLQAHGCQAMTSVDGMTQTLFLDGRSLGSWQLIFDDGCCRIELTGLLSLPPVCPKCCWSIINAGKALPGDVCPGCEPAITVNPTTEFA